MFVLVIGILGVDCYCIAYEHCICIFLLSERIYRFVVREAFVSLLFLVRIYSIASDNNGVVCRLWRLYPTVCVMLARELGTCVSCILIHVPPASSFLTLYLASDESSRITWQVPIQLILKGNFLAIDLASPTSRSGSCGCLLVYLFFACPYDSRGGIFRRRASIDGMRLEAMMMVGFCGEVHRERLCDSHGYGGCDGEGGRAAVCAYTWWTGAAAKGVWDG